MTKRAFTIIEVLIAVAIIGILAAVIVPQFQDYAQKAKESNAKANLKILRNAIERYAARNDGLSPGHYSDTPISATLTFYFKKWLTVSGSYLSEIPENPFNNLNTLKAVQTTDAFPEKADGSTGWTYKPAAKKIKLNYPGTDSQGVAYYDY